MAKHEQQIGALCFRQTGKRELSILLVTSRDTGRWVIPKGWPIKGKKLHRSAAIEALEEAGVEGAVGNKPLGQFVYDKREKNRSTTISVTVYPLHVKKQQPRWPEHRERRRKWFAADVAATKVDEPELSALMEAAAESSRRGEFPFKA